MQKQEEKRVVVEVEPKKLRGKQLWIIVAALAGLFILFLKLGSL